MASKITNSFPVLQAEADKYHSTRSSTPREIVEVWNYAVAREADKACLVGACGVISTPISGAILGSHALFNVLSIYGGPIAKFISPACFDVSLVLVMGTPMIASVAANTIGVTRLFRVLASAIGEKKMDDAASVRILPRNPRVRKNAVAIISEMGQEGARLAALKYKPATFMGRFLDTLRM